MTLVPPLTPALLRDCHARARGWAGMFQRHGLVLARVPCEPEFPAALQLEALRHGAVEPSA